MDFTTENAYVLWLTGILLAANRGLTPAEAVVLAKATSDAAVDYHTW